MDFCLFYNSKRYFDGLDLAKRRKCNGKLVEFQRIPISGRCGVLCRSVRRCDPVQALLANLVCGLSARLYSDTFRTVDRSKFLTKNISRPRDGVGVAHDNHHGHRHLARSQSPKIK